MENLVEESCCGPNEELERREYATRMVRDLSDAVRSLQTVSRTEVPQRDRSVHDKTVRAILDKIRGLLEEI